MFPSAWRCARLLAVVTVASRQSLFRLRWFPVQCEPDSWNNTLTTKHKKKKKKQKREKKLPIASDITVPWETLLISVVLYVLLPLIAGVITRHYLEKNNDGEHITSFLSSAKPWSIVGLLGTVILLFGFQALRILEQPLIIMLIAIPLLIQTYGIFAIAYAAAKVLKLPYNIAAPACMIATSNFFELAVAVAISLFGLHSGAALATVVGVLVEVPVMLSLVYFANKTQHWFALNK